MMEIGRVCVKTAGRDAGKLAIILDKTNEITVLVDGNVRRKNCNIKHLEPTEKVLKIKPKANTPEVLTAMKEAGLPVEKKPKTENKTKEETKKQPKKEKATAKK